MEDSISSQIKKLISQALKNLGIEVPVEEIYIEHPIEESYGDYATNVALKIYKNLGDRSQELGIKKPLDLAEKIVKQISLTSNPQLLTSVSAAPPGFINFFLSNKFLTDQLNLILKDNIRYGLNHSLKDKTLMVEFAHPNTHKMFHIGHLRNITTGEAIVRILEAGGAKVIRVNYQGDVGMHIAKCLYGILKDFYSRHPEPAEGGAKGPVVKQGILRFTQNDAFKKRRFAWDDILKELRTKYKTIDEKMEFLGKMYAQGSKAYEEDEQAKEEITALNAKIYNKDPEIWDLYKETRQWSLDYFEKIYKRVYTHFDRYYFESEVADLGKKIVLENLCRYPEGAKRPKDLLKNKGILRFAQNDGKNYKADLPLKGNKFQLPQDQSQNGGGKPVFDESEGAIIFDGEKYGLHKRVFINKEGFPTYEAKDIGLGKLQFDEYCPDLIIHVVGPEQAGYFKVVFEALAQLFPETRGKEFHLIYGWVRLKKGKMSSRLGNVILGEWLIEELKKRLMAILKICRHPEAVIRRPKDPMGMEKDKGDSSSASWRTQNDGDFEEILEATAIAAAKYSFLKVAPLQEIAFDIEESVNLQGDSGPYIQYTYARTQSVIEKNAAGSKQPVVWKNAKNEVPHTTYYILHAPKYNREELSILRTLYKFPEVVLTAGEKYSPNLICEFLFDLCQKYNLFYNKHRILNAETPELKEQRLKINEAVGIIIKNGMNLLGIKALEKM